MQATEEIKHIFERVIASQAQVSDEDFEYVRTNIDSCDRPALVHLLDTVPTKVNDQVLSKNCDLVNEFCEGGDPAETKSMLNVQDSNGDTVLHRIAVSGTNYELVSVLIFHGADPLIENSKNEACFSIAKDVTEFARAMQNGYNLMQENAERNHIPEKKLFEEIDKIKYQIAEGEDFAAQAEAKENFFKELNALARKYVNTPVTTRALLAKCKNFDTRPDYKPEPGKLYKQDAMDNRCDQGCPMKRGVIVHGDVCHLRFWIQYLDYLNEDTNKQYVKSREQKRSLFYKLVEQMLTDIENNCYKYEKTYYPELTPEEYEASQVKHAWYVEQITKLQLAPLQQKVGTLAAG